LGGSKKLGTNDIWNICQWAGTFCSATQELYSRFCETNKQNGVLSWDKDDGAAMKFVASCANIRAHIFHISGKSLFDTKAMAGNIIPAIATTNACVAGMILVEALKIVNGDFDKCRSVYIKQQPNPRGKILVDEKSYPPNPNCYVCSEKRQVVLNLNIEKMEVGRLRDIVLIGALNMIEPDVMDLFSNRVIISSEEGETDGIMSRTLSSIGIRNGSQLECDDFKQQLNFKLLLLHSQNMAENEFEIGSSSSDSDPSDNANHSEPEVKQLESNLKHPLTAVDVDETSTNPAKRSRIG